MLHYMTSCLRDRRSVQGMFPGKRGATLRRHSQKNHVVEEHRQDLIQMSWASSYPTNYRREIGSQFRVEPYNEHSNLVLRPP
jgi:hypothetical protein